MEDGRWRLKLCVCPSSKIEIEVGKIGTAEVRGRWQMADEVLICHSRTSRSS
jgi:hypothetical protein